MKRQIKLKYSKLAEFRKKVLKENKNMCPVLKQKIEKDNAVLDHIHKLKNEKVGIDNKGLCRGVVHNGVNVVEGKIQKAFIRYGLRDKISVPEFLRSLADYIEDPPLFSKPVLYIHPSEIRSKKINKNWFNKLNKKYKVKYPKRKALEYPKSGKLTKKIQKIAEEFSMEIIYKK